MNNFMKNNRSVTFIFGAFAFLVCCFLLNVSLGSVSIPVSEIIQGFFTGEWEKTSYEQIILYYRLPKAILAILAGIGLSISGLQMQTFFRNPLAGPYVLESVQELV